MPPVIMTRLMPQLVMMSAALALRMLKNIWGLVKPPPWKMIAPIYIRKKMTIVIASSRLVSLTLVKMLPFFLSVFT